MIPTIHLKPINTEIKFLIFTKDIVKYIVLSQQYALLE